MATRRCSRTGRIRLSENHFSENPLSEHPASENPLIDGLGRYFSREELQKLNAATIGIAGAGGLGSNAAMMLCRSGIGGFFLLDDDTVDKSNLNRQYFMPRHLGRPKVEALAETLLELNPDLRLAFIKTRLDGDNISLVIGNAPIWVEALDGAESKTLLVENALMAGLRVASASGLCGYGGPPLAKRKMGNLVLVGDFMTSCEMAPPLAPRVTQAASLLADSVLEFVLQ